MATATVVLSLDNDPFLKGIRKAMAVTAAASRQFARTPFKTTAIIGGLAGAGEIGAKAFKMVGIGALAAGVALAAGTVHAFTLGSEMVDLGARTGIATGKLLIIQQALKDAGVEAGDTGVLINKMQKFVAAATNGVPASVEVLDKLGLSIGSLQAMSPDEQFEALGKAIGGVQDPALKTAAAMEVFGRSGGKLLSAFSDLRGGGLRGAAEVVGRQAGILQRNTVIFDKISDQLGHAGTKLQSFFIGVADRVSGTLSPILDKLEKIDLAGIGQKFGDGIVKGAKAIAGAFQDPREIGAFIEQGFDYGLRAGLNIMVAGFNSGIEFFKGGMIGAIAGIGETIAATLIDAFQSPIAWLQAGIEKAMIEANPNQPNSWASQQKKRFAIGIQKTRIERLEGLSPEWKGWEEQTEAGKQKGLAGERAQLKKMVDEFRADVEAETPTFEELYNEKMKKGGVKFGGFGQLVGMKDEGMTTDEMRAHGQRAASEGIANAFDTLKDFKVPDVFGAEKAKRNIGVSVERMAAKGEPIIPKKQPITPEGRTALANIGSLGRKKAYEIAYGPDASKMLAEEERKRREYKPAVSVPRGISGQFAAGVVEKVAASAPQKPLEVNAPKAIPVDAPKIIPVSAPASIPVNAPASIPVQQTEPVKTEGVQTISVKTAEAIGVAAPKSIPIEAPGIAKVEKPENVGVNAPSQIGVAMPTYHIPAPEFPPITTPSIEPYRIPKSILPFEEPYNAPKSISESETPYKPAKSTEPSATGPASSVAFARGLESKSIAEAHEAQMRRIFGSDKVDEIKARKGDLSELEKPAATGQGPAPTGFHAASFFTDRRFGNIGGGTAFRESRLTGRGAEQGLATGRLGTGGDQAYGLVRRGDAAREKALAAEVKKKKDPVEGAAKATARNTKLLLDSFGEKGGVDEA